MPAAPACGRCGGRWWLRDADGDLLCGICRRPPAAPCACAPARSAPAADRVLALIRQGEIRRAEIIARLGIPPRTVDHALQVLKRRGAIRVRRDASYRLA